MNMDRIERSYEDMKSMLTFPTVPPPVLPAHTNVPFSLKKTGYSVKDRAKINRAIVDLSLHPTLEAMFHILNYDLESAHFLVRHMESPPRWEGMMIHGILHRVEGDLENARSWYRDVCNGTCGGETVSDIESRGANSGEDDREVFWAAIWGEAEGSELVDLFLDRLKGLLTRSRSRIPDGQRNEYIEEYNELQKTSEQEISSILDWCERKFGTEKCEDATVVWTSKKGGLKTVQTKQLVGGEGWRKF